MNSLDPAEIQNFSKDSGRWWDETGPFAPLHRLNPVRLGYLKARICKHFGRDETSFEPFKGLSVLDVGCGGGLVCEPMARLGARVTGIDADAQAIEVAGAHAEDGGLAIDYKVETTGDLLRSSPLPEREDLGTEINKQHRTPSALPSPHGRGSFDVVLALEIIEHVADVDSFVEECVNLCKPGGLLIFSTLNRTPKSFALGIVAAEYILRWVPRGTHSWKKFLRPSELAKALRKYDCDVADITGMVFDPMNGNFKLSDRDTDVNYFVTAARVQA